MCSRDVIYCEKSFINISDCFLSPACAACWGGSVSQQPLGPFTGPAGSGGGALPAAWAQCGRLALLLQHGSVWPGGVQTQLDNMNSRLLKPKKMPMLWCNRAMRPEALLRFLDTPVVWQHMSPARRDAPVELDTHPTSVQKPSHRFLYVWNNNEYTQDNCTSVQCSYYLTSENQVGRFAI